MLVTGTELPSGALFRICRANESFADNVKALVSFPQELHHRLREHLAMPGL